MRVIVALAALTLVIGCAKKDDPVPATPSAVPSASATQARAGGSGNPVPGTPYVPGAGGVSPVQGGDFGGSGGGVGQAAISRAQRVAGSVSGKGTTPDSGSGE